MDRPPIRIVRTDVLHESTKFRVVRDLQDLPDGTILDAGSRLLILMAAERLRRTGAQMDVGTK